MKRDREYFRVSTVARVSLRAVEEADVENARRRVHLRHVPDPIAKHGVEDARIANEARAMLDVLSRISLALDRIDRRIEEIAHLQLGNEAGPLASLRGDPIDVVLSGSGFSVPYDMKLETGTFVEAYLDLWNAGLPLIPALARVARVETGPGDGCTGLGFCEIAPADRERIVQLAIRCQSEHLSGGRCEREAEEGGQ